MGPALLKALGEEDEGSEEFEAAAHGSFVVVVGAKWCFCGCWRWGLRLVCWGDRQSLARKETGKKINVCEKEPCNSPWKSPATSRSGDLAWDATGLNLRSCRRRGSCLLASPQRAPSAPTLERRQGRDRGGKLEIQGANHCHCFVHRQGSPTTFSSRPICRLTST